MDSPERWLPVVGFEGRYEVSDLGRVRALVAWRRWKAGRIVGGTPHKRGGYLRVALRDAAGKEKRRFIHNLVLEAFVGLAPPGLQARHDDGDPTHNALSNLCWGTSKENAADRDRHGRTVMPTRTSDARAETAQRMWEERHAGTRKMPVLPTGEQHKRSKLTWEKVDAIRAALDEGTPATELAQRYGVSPGTIGFIKRNETWRKT